MALFANVKNGIVTNVIIAESDFIDLLPDPANWVEAYAGFEDNPKGMEPSVGDTYNAEVDKFYPVKPYPSWVWNEENWWWEAPVPYPEDNMQCTDHECLCCVWDEESVSWGRLQRQIADTWEMNSEQSDS